MTPQPQQKHLTESEYTNQLNRYYTMARMHLEETDKKEFNQMVTSKTLANYLIPKSEAMMQELIELMDQGMDQRTANEIVVHQHIIE